MNQAFLLTGGNLGNRLENMQQAYLQIKQLGQIKQESPVYETAAWGMEEQPPFLNQVLLISTTLTAGQLLKAILEIEQQLGRKRVEKLGPRIIDIDILFFNSDVIATENLTIPHPQISNRRFVLTPLNDIAPNFIHPVLQKTVTELLSSCPDPLPVKRYDVEEK